MTLTDCCVLVFDSTWPRWWNEFDLKMLYNLWLTIFRADGPNATLPSLPSLGWLYNCIYWGKGSRICIWTVVISVCRRARRLQNLWAAHVKLIREVFFCFLLLLLLLLGRQELSPWRAIFPNIFTIFKVRDASSCFRFSFFFYFPTLFLLCYKYEIVSCRRPRGSGWQNLCVFARLSRRFFRFFQFFHFFCFHFHFDFDSDLLLVAYL